MNKLENITVAMNRLEVEIARQQAHINKVGAANDAGPFDKNWNQYKEDAQYNLDKWDAMKLERNTLKQLRNSI